MIVLYTGRPGSGKSLKVADEIIRILNRNYKWYWKEIKKWKKNGRKGDEPKIRYVLSNLKLSPKLEKKYKNFIKYWSDPIELIEMRDVDVFWDEIATHLDSSQYKETPLVLKRWLQQHRKFGIEIRGTTQDFAMIDIAMRRMTSDVMYLTKLFGSRDPSPTRPPIKFVWGLIITRKIDPIDYKEDEKNTQTTGFGLFKITKKRVSVFDTRQEIEQGRYPPYQHYIRKCVDPKCSFTKVIHT